MSRFCFRRFLASPLLLRPRPWHLQHTVKLIVSGDKPSARSRVPRYLVGIRFAAAVHTHASPVAIELVGCLSRGWRPFLRVTVQLQSLLSPTLPVRCPLAGASALSTGVPFHAFLSAHLRSRSTASLISDRLHSKPIPFWPSHPRS